jgi:hypothetical protein
MYCVAFITFNKNKAKNSKEAISYAEMNFQNIGCLGWITCKNVDNVFDWWKLNRVGFSSIFSNKYQLTGFDDNAMILTSYVYNEVLKIFEKYDQTNQDVKWIHTDLEKEGVSTDFIDKKWIVVTAVHLM